MDLTRTQREVVGRAAMLLFFGLLPLWGGVKCIRTARWMDDEFERQHFAHPPGRNETSGSGLPFAIGVVLVVIGSVFVLTPLLPVAAMERILGSPGNTTLWRDGKPDAPLYRSAYWD